VFTPPVRLPKFTSLRELGARLWVRRALLAVPVLALMSLFIATGFRGIDFGTHWDEIPWHIQPAREMIGNGVFLPRAYIYPSLSKWLVLWPAVRGGIETAWQVGLDHKAIQTAMMKIVAQPDYLLQARRIFVVVSAFGILWLYVAALVLGRRWWEAFIAAACLGLSWEFAYHARWLANDCLLTQFAALTLLMLALFERTRLPAWLYGAAVAAGLGTSTKYPGVVLLVPILIVGASSLSLRAVRAQLFRAVTVCAVAFGAYVVTSPGTLLDPFVFLYDAHRINAVYSKSHYGYTVTSTAQHFKIALTYLTVSYFSPWKLAAAAMAGSVIWGAVLWLRRERRFGAVLVAFPAAFLIFFCAKYRVAVARNYVLLVPFLALLAARGVADVVDRLPRRWLRTAALSGLAVLAVAQAAFLVRAGESIKYPDVDRDARDAVAFVANHPREVFRISARVRALAAAQHLTLPTNVSQGAAPADAAVFFIEAEGPGPYNAKTNDAWLTRASFGPREVNINWYSTWEGRDRIVVVNLDRSKPAAIPLKR
jgi:Dolichyl-phosphate-mannose-protein mannosyltransferase